MQIRIYQTRMVITVLLALVLAGGLATAWAAPASPPPQASGIYVEQDPMTAYMQSQVGTPNELSPIAPAEARNIRKVGGRWCCDLNGQARVFNGATSCWELQKK